MRREREREADASHRQPHVLHTAQPHVYFRSAPLCQPSPNLIALPLAFVLRPTRSSLMWQVYQLHNWQVYHLHNEPSSSATGMATPACPTRPLGAGSRTAAAQRPQRTSAYFFGLPILRHSLLSR